MGIEKFRDSWAKMHHVPSFGSSDCLASRQVYSDPLDQFCMDTHWMPPSKSAFRGASPEWWVANLHASSRQPHGRSYTNSSGLNRVYCYKVNDAVLIFDEPVVETKYASGHW